MAFGIELTRGLVQGRGIEAARLIPRNAICATIDWPLPPENSEQSIRPEIVTALSHALTACGTVAFRCDEPLIGADAYFATGSSLADRLLNFAGQSSNRFGIAIATNPKIVEALFTSGTWTFALQAALLFDPNADPTPIRDALRTRLDWTKSALPNGARLLFGRGHDGDFAVIATHEPHWAEQFEIALSAA